MKRSLKLSLLAVAVVIATVVVLIGCFGLPSPLPIDPSLFTAKGYFEADQPALGDLDAPGHMIHYARTGTDTGPTVIFVHGSPGSWENFARFLDDPDLRKAATMVAVDRPGYGGSGKGKPERSLAAQAAALRPFLDVAHDKESPVVLVGHSYGGPVAVRAAMDFPDRVAALILVAPSIDPDLENLPWYQHVGGSFFVRWMLPSMLDVSNQEVLALRAQLRDILPKYEKLTLPVTVLQGDHDSLVDPRNADFAERRFTHAQPLSVVRIEGADHFIPWTHDAVMRRAILNQIDRVGAAKAAR